MGRSPAARLAGFFMALKKNIRWFSPRAHSRLKEAASSNTVIITALAGFGKTTAGEYIWEELLAKRAKKVWHTCLDGSPLSKWKRFCAKAGRIDPQAGTALLSLGPPGKTSSGAAASILSDISPDEETWLFIDDFHKFVRSGIDAAAWGAFWRREAGNLHAAVMTRSFADEGLSEKTITSNHHNSPFMINSKMLLDSSHQSILLASRRNFSSASSLSAPTE
jgi:ATP/maltotriose-dependent transcriptional regulator MalT